MTIRDNGEGITPERLRHLGRQMLDSSSGIGMAVYNVNRRLTLMYGQEASLNINSNQAEGTEIKFQIPAAVKR